MWKYDGPVNEMLHVPGKWKFIMDLGRRSRCQATSIFVKQYYTISSDENIRYQQIRCADFYHETIIGSKPTEEKEKQETKESRESKEATQTRKRKRPNEEKTISRGYYLCRRRTGHVTATKIL
jgi:hypothetical protein